MKKPWEISILDFTYELPADRIAQFPLEQRDQSKLLFYQGEDIQSYQFDKLPDLLPANSLVVVNSTKVVKARLIFKNENGGKIELFCLEPAESLPSFALNQTGTSTWKTMVGGLKKWKQDYLHCPIPGYPNSILRAKLQSFSGNLAEVEFSWEPGQLTFSEVLENLGNVPLPPYMKREVEKSDEDRYQTTYNKYPGSVAAPTAGLHFTPQVLERIKVLGHQMNEVCLHVGAGTFAPVKSKTMKDHPMHAEWLDVSMDFLLGLKKHIGNPVIAVGTTSLRTLESLYWIGVKLSLGENLYGSEFLLSQWEPYELPSSISLQESLSVLINYLKNNGEKKLIGQTQILIVPGYEFKVVNGLVTNFHQPNSTLLLLIASFVGEKWSEIYQYALAHQYRFLSYGDSSFLLNRTSSISM